MTLRAVIKGTGSALPKKRVTNVELSETVDTSDEWIFERTGIRSRYVAGPDETTSTLGTAAARAALQASGMDISEIDLIIVGTCTPDQTFPATASTIQHNLGANGNIAFDVSAVCSGFVYGLSVAESMIRAGSAKNAIVIGAETMSRVVDWNDRGTCVLFGDGAGAVVLAGEEGERGVLASKLHTDGAYGPALYADGGPSSTQTVGKCRMNGKEVFRHAVTNLANVLIEALESAGIAAHDVDWVVPHQANSRIIEGTAKKLGLSMDRVIMTVSEHANTSAASVPLALDIAVRDGRIKQGDTVVFEAMGAGFAWGATVVKM